MSTRLSPDAAEPSSPHVRPAPRRRWVPAFVLAVGLAVTALATAHLAFTAKTKERVRFENAVRFTTQHITHDLDNYVSLLRGAQGLFAASTEVLPTEFRTYVEHLDLPTRHPGVVGLGFCKRISAGEKDELTARMRREGFEDFGIWPESTDPESLPVIHFEPLDTQRRRILGFDTFTDPSRRAVAEQACVTGFPVASGKIPLAQETDGPPPAGFVIFVPVYRSGAPRDTPAERRAALDGFVYSPFRVEELLEQILKHNATVNVRFFDGAADEQNLLYSSAPSQFGSSDRRAPELLRTSSFQIAGHTFSAQMTPGPALSSDSAVELPVSTGLAGLAVSFLLFIVTASLARARAAAERTATELRRQEERRARRASHLALRAEVSTTLTTRGSDIRQILQTCAEAIIHQLNLAFVRIWTLSMDGKVLELQASAGLHTNLRGAHARIGLGQLKIGRIAQQRMPQICTDLANDKIVSHPEWAKAQQLTAFAGFPLLVEGRLVGVLAMFSRQALEEDTLDAIGGLAELLAQGIERKRAEQIVLEQRHELEDFVSIVAHDLKHPVVSVQGLLGLLRQEAGDRLDDTSRENLEMALAECGRMKGIIAQLGYIARIGSTDVRPEPVQLRRFLDGVVQRFAHVIEKQGAEVSVQAPEVTAMLPRVQVDEALDNLLTNALQYGCTGTDRRIFINCTVEESVVAIAVQDHGAGIDPRYHERVFEMFRRLDPAGPVPGTGVGLTAVHRLVRRIGGTVSLHSAAGRGATFTIRFPAQLLTFEEGRE